MRIVRRDKRRNGGRIAIAFRGERRIIVVTDRLRRDVNFQTRVRRRRLAAAVPRGGGRRGGRLLIFVAIPAGCTTCVYIYIRIYHCGVATATRPGSYRNFVETRRDNDGHDGKSNPDDDVIRPYPSPCVRRPRTPTLRVTRHRRHRV